MDLPKILLVTPELAYLPEDAGIYIERYGKKFRRYLSGWNFPKSGGLADMTSPLAIELKNNNVNIGIALPYIPKGTQKHISETIEEETEKLQGEGFVEGRNLFFVKNEYFDNLDKLYAGDGRLFSLLFQKEVLNNIIPHWQPSLTHTHDWTTGFIGSLSHPDIKNLHTIHNFHDEIIPQDILFSFGLPLYNSNKLWMENYDSNKIKFQLSGIFGSDFINTPSRGWLEDIVDGRVPGSNNLDFVKEVRNKLESARAWYVLNAPDTSYASEDDSNIPYKFSLEDIIEMKKLNKVDFQSKKRLNPDYKAPLIVWTNRADPVQKGIHLLNDSLDFLMNRYKNPGLQIAIVADGPYISVLKKNIHNLEENGFKGRISISGFSDEVERQAYAAGDALLNFSLYAPCELVQMKGSKYGCIPIVRKVGGLRDSVCPISKGGNGIVAEHYDTNSLIWAINEFLTLYHGDKGNYFKTVKKVKKFADDNFTVGNMAKNYVNLYERILDKKVK